MPGARFRLIILLPMPSPENRALATSRQSARVSVVKRNIQGVGQLGGDAMLSKEEIAENKLTDWTLSWELQ